MLAAMLLSGRSGYGSVCAMRKCVYEIDVPYEEREECAGSARYSKFVV